MTPGLRAIQATTHRPRGEPGGGGCWGSTEQPSSWYGENLAPGDIRVDIKIGKLQALAVCIQPLSLQRLGLHITTGFTSPPAPPHPHTAMAGGIPSAAPALAGGYLTGRALVFPLSLVISLFFLWGFSYGLLDVLNKHFQTVLDISRLESTGLQVMYFGGGYLLFSPVAAECLKRRGYKTTILMGLGLYSLGAILFWPVAHSSTVTNQHKGRLWRLLRLHPRHRLRPRDARDGGQLVRRRHRQARVGLDAAAVLPVVERRGVLHRAPHRVKFVYLAVSCAGVAVAVLFFFTRLPEISEQTIEDAGPSADAVPGHRAVGEGPIYKQLNLVFAAVAQFCYVGAQVTVATFFINYANENGGFTTSQASNMLSYALMTFTIGRFVGTALATCFATDFIVMVWAACAIALNAYVCVGSGTPAVAVLIVVFFFEAPMYPSIFAMGTANLGHHTRRGAGIMVAAVSGGALFPVVQGAIADAIGTRVSYFVPLVGFVYVLGYVTFHWIRHGLRIKAVKAEDHPVAETDVVTAEDGIEKKRPDAWVERT
ncbi:Glucose/galactose transporter [Colletotrichum orbiculare MAFF 240422]|uniref:Glucose/galactose transporter n=1 Tax=Colletotrichum orbiculare (strain 104-T / ATCC 96160 / CBS 514.97 / LARS 414 / MAFF 240422) TaxID=1213857 RepID=A0A484FQM8_COLOR|nr:Glucose/galactose transporter [Colletotrichum orbiculare MAFF 240422]